MANNEYEQIKYLFEPRGVAVIGASSQPGKVGHSIVRNMKTSGYQGEIYPVNPKGGEVMGIAAYKSLLDIKGPIDLATIVIPAKFVMQAVRECAEKGVKYLSVITSGFSEVGNLEEEKQMVQFANENGMRILGPNIFGIYSANANMNATFGPAEINPGGVAIITQSGALGIAMIGKTQVENIGLSAIVSVGNKSDLDEADLLEYLVRDETTKVVIMYIEGLKKGEQLLEKLKWATAQKPVIVIKSGRSKRGAMAAASHTGSLAGADEIFSAVMKQCGVHRAISIQDALDWSKFLSDAPVPKGDNSVIITNGGGVGVLAADACEEHAVHLFDDLPTLQAAFSESVPSYGSVKNPVDITGGAVMADYEAAIESAFNHPEIHSVICLGCETATLTGETFRKSIQGIYDKFKETKPVVFSFFGGEEIERNVTHLKTQGVPMFTDVGQAVACLGEAYFDARNRQQTTDTEAASAKELGVDLELINEIAQGARKDGRKFLLAQEGQDVMKAAGVRMPQSILSKSLSEAVEAAEKINYPVVMKVVSRDILHKSDAGGVALDLQNKEEVMDAYEAILHNCRRYKPDARIKGIEVMEMVRPGTETIIGARKDAIFGPVVMFGLGGIYVEVMKDIAFRALPVTRNEILGMMKEIRSYPLLLGVRGEEKKDIESVRNVIERVSAILKGCEDISDIEINPLVAYDEGDGVMAVDVRILLS
jgi:acetyl coenzyme A synthetase (ADP forming)-like protein